MFRSVSVSFLLCRRKVLCRLRQAWLCLSSMLRLFANCDLECKNNKLEYTTSSGLGCTHVISICNDKFRNNNGNLKDYQAYLCNHV